MLALVLFLFISATLLSLVLTPVIRDVFQRRGWVDQPDQIRKTHLIAVPRIGGIAIFAAYSITFAFAFLLPFNIRAYPSTLSTNVTGIMIAITIVFLTGLLDDLHNLRPWQKFSGIGIAALIAFQSGVKVQFLNCDWSTYATLPITLLWLVGCANAFNLIDGMDGLASGIGLVSTLTMLIAAMTQSHLMLILLTVPLLGVLLGFLRYNFNPASVFLGDCGSLTLGFTLGCFGALWSQKAATLLGLTAPLFALSVPIVDVALAIVRRFLRNQPIFQGDAAHIHHRLLGRGLTVRRAALILYGVCALASVASLVVTTFQQKTVGSIVVVGFGVFIWAAIQQLKYTEFSVVRNLLFTNNFRHYVDTHTRFASFEEKLSESVTIEELWSVISESVHQFHFLGARLSINGVVYENLPADLGRTQHWQLRIPLPESQHANFYRSFGEEISPLMINVFVVAIESNIRRVLNQNSAVAEREFSGPVGLEAQVSTS